MTQFHFLEKRDTYFSHKNHTYIFVTDLFTNIAIWEAAHVLQLMNR